MEANLCNALSEPIDESLCNNPCLVAVYIKQLSLQNLPSLSIKNNTQLYIVDTDYPYSSAFCNVPTVDISGRILFLSIHITDNPNLEQLCIGSSSFFYTNSFKIDSICLFILFHIDLPQLTSLLTKEMSLHEAISFSMTSTILCFI